jgi:chaperonin GroEL
MRLDKFSWDWFGSARSVAITKDQTTIIDGKGKDESIRSRIEELQEQIEKAKTSFEQEKLQERLAKFVGGVAIVYVGGNTETEIKEKKDRVEDALYATKAAIEEGIVAGGGSALLFAREAITYPKEDSDAVRIGKQIVYRSCGKPFEQILLNAGYTQNDMYPIINEISAQGEVGTKPWFGFNIKEEAIVNMKEVGIIDPVKVTRTALENAASVAGTVLLTECVIVDDPEDKKDNNDFGGMGGMF